MAAVPFPDDADYVDVTTRYVHQRASGTWLPGQVTITAGTVDPPVAVSPDPTRLAPGDENKVVDADGHVWVLRVDGVLFRDQTDVAWKCKEAVWTDNLMFNHYAVDDQWYYFGGVDQDGVPTWTKTSFDDDPVAAPKAD